MRKFVILAGVLASCALTGCNPPQQKLVSVPCNCHGSVAVTNPDAETPRLAPPDVPAEYRSHTVWRAHRTPHRSYHYATRTRHHGYQGSDEQYERDWSYQRVAMSTYEYRSTSRSYRGESHYSHTSGYDTGNDDGFVDVPSHYETDDSWRDGHGRSHAASYVGGRALAARMDPWRGYDVDCPENDPRYRGRR